MKGRTVFLWGPPQDDDAGERWATYAAVVTGANSTAHLSLRRIRPDVASGMRAPESLAYIGPHRDEARPGCSAAALQELVLVLVRRLRDAPGFRARLNHVLAGGRLP